MALQWPHHVEPSNHGYVSYHITTSHDFTTSRQLSQGMVELWIMSYVYSYANMTCHEIMSSLYQDIMTSWDHVIIISWNHDIMICNHHVTSPVPRYGGAVYHVLCLRIHKLHRGPLRDDKRKGAVMSCFQQSLTLLVNWLSTTPPVL